MKAIKSDKGAVAIVTLGCKVNYAESATILDALVSDGWRIARPDEAAGLVVVHTCAVTAQAEQKSRQQIRKAVRKNPGAKVVVIGCYAQLDPGRLAAIDGVSLVLGNADKLQASRYAGASGQEPVIRVSPVTGLREAAPACSMLSNPEAGRTRAFLKIQDGCSFGCSYCTIPLARGRSRSVPLGSLLDTAARLAEAGYREIALTGINIADYRDGDTGFAGLLRRLDAVPVDRIRIGSVEPDLLDDELIETVAASSRIMPHFHLPLQSGSDRVLRLMGRHYDTGSYRERLMRAVTGIRDCAIGADVMVGYPGEREEDFDAMYRFIEALPVAYLHVFNCSVRPGTVLSRQVAERLLAPVPRAEAASRASRLGELAGMIERRFSDPYIGRSLSVLFEESRILEDGRRRWSGYTGNYLRIDVDLDAGSPLMALKGSERAVVVEGRGDGLNLQGRLLF